eukprot:SAG31_NODE_2162_length_6294_cov_4.696691_1_plen_101_part_10
MASGSGQELGIGRKRGPGAASSGGLRSAAAVASAGVEVELNLIRSREERQLRQIEFYQVFEFDNKPHLSYIVLKCDIESEEPAAGYYLNLILPRRYGSIPV